MPGSSGREKEQQPAISHQSSFGDELLIKIQDEINAAMHLSDSVGEKFVTKKKLDEIWERHSPSSISAFENFKPNELKALKEDYLRVLSILVLMGWELQRFRPVFLRAGLDDSKLFFSLTELEVLGARKHVFYDFQFMFKPVVIEQDEDRAKQTVQKTHRLPFIGKPEPLGRGGFAVVTKRTIAAECFAEVKPDGTRLPYKEAKVVACKQFKPDRSEKSFQLEVQKLDLIKDSLNVRKNILRHITAIQHGTAQDDATFLILFPYVNNYNLEILLREGADPEKGTTDSKQWYQFDKRFPKIQNHVIRHQAVIKEAWNLAGALLFLHDQLKIYGNNDYYVAHCDFKPDNILIDGNPSDPRTPAGVWKLTDFGISAFEKSTSGKPNKNLTLRDFAERVTSTSTSKAPRGHGPYQPPEVVLEKDKESRLLIAQGGGAKMDSRKCDEWSFACVMCDLLGFSLNKNEGVKAMRRAKWDGQNANFYVWNITPLTAESVITKTNTSLKPNLSRWLDEISASVGIPPWVTEWITLIKRVLRPCQEHRPGMAYIHSTLNELPQDGLQVIEQSPQTLPAALQLHQNASNAMPVESQQNGTIDQNGYSALVGAQYNLPPAQDLANGIEHTPSQVSSDLQTSSTQESFVAASHVPDSSTESPATPVSRRPIRAPQLLTLQLRPSTPIRADKPLRLEGPDPLQFGVDKSTIKAVAIGATGKWVAVLCVTDESRVWIMPTKKSSSGIRNKGLTSTMSNVGLCIAHPYFAAWGSDQKNDKHLEIHDIEPDSEPRIIKGDFHGALSKVAMSSTGVTACAYINHVRLHFPTFATLSEINVPRHSGARINAISFAMNDVTLFVYIKGPGAADDHIYVFRCEEDAMQWKEPIRSLSISRKDASNVYESTIWPSFNASFCTIAESGGAFIARPSREPPNAIKSEPIEMKKVIYGLLPSEDVLLCLRNGSVYGYEIVTSSNGEKTIGKGHNLADKVTSKEGAVMAIEHVGRQYDLVVCCPKKGIIRYSQPP